MGDISQSLSTMGQYCSPKLDLQLSFNLKILKEIPHKSLKLLSLIGNSKVRLRFLVVIGVMTFAPICSGGSKMIKMKLILANLILPFKKIRNRLP